MRTIFVNVFLATLIPIVLLNPYFGMLSYYWFTFMNPHRLAWSGGGDIPWAKMMAGVMLVAWMLSNEPKRIPINAVTGLLLMMLAWVTVTSAAAMFPDKAWDDWFDFCKIVITTLSATALINSRRRLHAVVWILVISIAYWTVKGGLFVIATSGRGTVIGPADSQFPESNRFARVAIMIAPLMLWLMVHTANAWIRRGLLAALMLTLFAMFGTGSRGGLIAFLVAMTYAWLHSRHKILPVLFGVACLGAGIMVMSHEKLDDYVARFSSIGDYQTDASLQSRLRTWEFAKALIARKPVTGGGFGAFAANIQTSVDGGYLEAHSNYYEMWAEHGYPGLALYLMLAAATFHMGGRIQRLARGRPQLYWARDLSLMLRVSLIGYFVGGLVANTAFFEMYYTLMALMVVTWRLANQAAAPAAPGPGATA